MKNIICILLIAFLLSSCSKKESNLDNDFRTVLKLEITEINSNYTESFVIEEEDFIKTPIWYDNTTKGISIKRKIIFESQSPNLKSLKIKLSFLKIEQKELLILDDKKTRIIGEWEYIRNWDYKDNGVEITEFYNNSRLMLEINNLIPSGVPHQFKVTKAKEIEVDGKMVTWIQVQLSGELYGTYSPGEGEGLRIKGFFEGVME